MAVVISEIITEVVVGTEATSLVSISDPLEREELIEQAVRRATERVLETLRREWES